MLFSIEPNMKGNDDWCKILLSWKIGMEYEMQNSMLFNIPKEIRCVQLQQDKPWKISDDFNNASAFSRKQFCFCNVRHHISICLVSESSNQDCYQQNWFFAATRRMRIQLHCSLVPRPSISDHASESLATAALREGENQLISRWVISISMNMYGVGKYTNNYPCLWTG